MTLEPRRCGKSYLHEASSNQLERVSSRFNVLALFLNKDKIS